MSARATAVLGRTSDLHPDGAEAADALARELARRAGTEPAAVGEPGLGGARPWHYDLEEAAPALDAARDAVDDALADGDLPVIVASDCSICLGTLPVVARFFPSVRVVWFDAHGDFNTPETSPSGYLGGMCLAAACGRWDAGLEETIDPARVTLVGVRALDEAEAADVEAAGIARDDLDALAGEAVFIHLDLDVLDAGGLPFQFPVEGGMAAGELRDVLAALAAGSRVVGVEITSLTDPDLADAVADIVEPLLEAAR